MLRDPNNRLGRFIRQRREELGFSRAKLARLAELTYNTVRLIEQGRRGSVLNSTIVKLARVLDCDGRTLMALRSVRRTRRWRNNVPQGTIAARIFEERAKRGITGRQLAARIGCPAHTIYEVESGRTTPNTKTLQRIANGLGITLVELLKGVN